MFVPYTLFLEQHLDYLISKLFMLEGEEQQQMINSIRRVRDILNKEEELSKKYMIES
jgi:hypothetical protein